MVEKTLFVLSDPSSSLTLQIQMAQIRLKRSKFWVYIYAWKVKGIPRVTQILIRNSKFDYKTIYPLSHE